MKRFVFLSFVLTVMFLLTSCKKKVTTTTSVKEEELLNSGEVILNSFENLDDLYLIKPSSTHYSTSSRLDISDDWSTEGNSSLKITYFEGNTQFIMLLKNSKINNIDIKSIKSLSLDYYYPGEDKVTLITGFARKGSEMFNSVTQSSNDIGKGTITNEINGLIIESNESEFVGFKFEVADMKVNDVIYFDNLRISLGNELTSKDLELKAKINDVINEIDALEITSTEDFESISKVNSMINAIPKEYHQAIVNYEDYLKAIKTYLALSSGKVLEKEKLFHFDSFVGLTQISDPVKGSESFSISDEYTFGNEYENSLRIDYNGDQWNYVKLEMPLSITDYDYIKVSLYNDSEKEKAVFFTWNQRYDVLPNERVDVLISVNDLKLPLELEVTDLIEGNTTSTYGTLYVSPIYVYSSGYDIYMDAIDETGYQSDSLSISVNNGFTSLVSREKGISTISFNKKVERITQNEEMLFVLYSQNDNVLILNGEADTIKDVDIKKGYNAIYLNGEEYDNLKSYSIYLNESEEIRIGYSIIYRSLDKNVASAFALCSIYSDLDSLTYHDFEGLEKYLSSIESMSKYEFNTFKTNRNNECLLIDSLKYKMSSLKISLINDCISDALYKSELTYHDLDVYDYVIGIYETLSDSEKMEIISLSEYDELIGSLNIYKPVLIPNEKNLNVANTWSTKSDIEIINDLHNGKFYNITNVNQTGPNNGAIEFEYKGMDLDGIIKVYFSLTIPEGQYGIFYISLNSWRNDYVYELELSGPNTYEIELDPSVLSSDGYIEIYSDIICDEIRISSFYGLKEEYIVKEIIELIDELPDLEDMNPYYVSLLKETYEKTLSLSEDSLSKVTNYSHLLELLSYLDDYVSVLKADLSNIKVEDSWTTNANIEIYNLSTHGDVFYISGFDKVGDYTGAIEFKISNISKNSSLKTGFSFFMPEGQTGVFYVSAKNWRQTPIYEKTIEGGKWIDVLLDSIDLAEELYISVYANDYVDGWFITSFYGKLSDDVLKDSFESLNESSSIGTFLNFLNALTSNGNDSIKEEYMNKEIVKTLLDKFKGTEGTLISDLVKTIKVSGDNNQEWSNAIVPQGVYQVYSNDASEYARSVLNITLPKIDFSLFESVKFELRSDSAPVSINSFNAYSKNLINESQTKKFVIEVESNETESILYIYGLGESKGEGVKLNDSIRYGKEALSFEFITYTKYLWFTVNTIENEELSELKATLR